MGMQTSDYFQSPTLSGSQLAGAFSLGIWVLGIVSAGIFLAVAWHWFRHHHKRWHAIIAVVIFAVGLVLIFQFLKIAVNQCLV